MNLSTLLSNRRLVSECGRFGKTCACLRQSTLLGRLPIRRIVPLQFDMAYASPREWTKLLAYAVITLGRVRHQFTRCRYRGQCHMEPTRAATNRRGRQKFLKCSRDSFERVSQALLPTQLQFHKHNHRRANNSLSINSRFLLAKSRRHTFYTCTRR